MEARKALEAIEDYIARRKDTFEERIYSTYNDDRLTPNEKTKKVRELRDSKREFESNMAEITRAFYKAERTCEKYEAMNVEYQSFRQTLEGLKKLFPEDQRSIVDSVFSAYNKDRSEVVGGLRNEYDKARDEVTKVTARYGKNTHIIVDHVNYTLAALGERASFHDMDSYSKVKSDDYKATPDSSISSQMDELEQIEKDVNTNQIQMDPVVVKLNFFKSKTYTPHRMVYDAKAALTRMSEASRVIDAIDHCIDEARSIQGGKFERTIEALKKFKESQKKLIADAQTEFNAIPFDKLREAEAELEEERRRQQGIQLYANEYYQYLKTNDRIKKEEFLTSCREIAAHYGLSDTDIFEAEMKAKDRLHEEEMTRMWEESERLREKRREEDLSIEQQRQFDELYDKIAREMAWAGWAPPGGTPMKNGGTDVDAAEDARLFDEEVRRRVREAMGLNKKTEPMAPEIPTPEMMTPEEPTPEIVAPEVPISEIAPEVVECFEDMEIALGQNPEGLLPKGARKAETMDFYMTTINMTPQERALASLKKFDFLPQDVTLENIAQGPHYMREVLAAQIRIETQITSILNKLNFSLSKRNLNAAQAIGISAQEIEKQTGPRSFR